MENAEITEMPETTKKKGHRTPGATNWKKNVWDVIWYDPETHLIRKGKYASVKQLNEDTGLNLTSCVIKRLMTHERVDEDQKMGRYSFIQKWGHICIVKISEDIVRPNTKSNKRPSPGA